jgi:Ras-related protein Rab-18
MSPHVELPQAEFKVVLLGDTNTGKTSLVLRFVEGYYKESGRSATVGAFFLTKRITVQQMITCKLLLWDTAGQAPFQKLAKTYYQQAAAAIFTYDVSQPQSLHRLRLLLDEVLQNTAGRRMVLAIAACKTDLDKSLHHPGLQEEAQKLATTHNALYIATSAKTDAGVQSLFEQTAQRVWQWHREAAVGVGLPIPVTTGGTVSSKSAEKQLHNRSRSLDKQPLVSSTPKVKRPTQSAPRVDTPPPGKILLSPQHNSATPKSHPLKTIDSSNDTEENSDDLVVNDETKDTSSHIMCEGTLLSCTDDPTKGCSIL